MAFGNGGNDHLSAGAGADKVNAGTGHDTVDGGAEHNLLNLEDGNDLAQGGLGADALNAGVFETHSFELSADGSADGLTLREIAPASSGPEINMDGPIFSYSKAVEIGGDTVEVAAFALGQSKLFQPKGAFGAMFLDWEGNLYFGLNRGDHDLEDGTDATGGIHCVDLDWNEGTAYAEFMAEPKATTH